MWHWIYIRNNCCSYFLRTFFHKGLFSQWLCFYLLVMFFFKWETKCTIYPLPIHEEGHISEDPYYKGGFHISINPPAYTHTIFWGNGCGNESFIPISMERRYLANKEALLPPCKTPSQCWEHVTKYGSGGVVMHACWTQCSAQLCCMAN